MIESESQYQLSREALRELEEALAALRKRLLPANPALFSVAAQDYLGSIREIRSEIDAYIGVSAAQADHAPLWMSLEGAGLSVENISTGLLTRWLKTLKRTVLATAQFLESGESSRPGRPSARLSGLCDFRLVEFQPGSLKIGLELPRAGQLELGFEDSSTVGSIAEKALEEVLETVTEIADLKEQHRLSSMQLDDRKRVLVREVLHLIPTRASGVEAVTLEGAAVPRRWPVRLPSSLRAEVNAVIAATRVEDIKEAEGVVREIDLDQRRFILRERPGALPPLHCYFPEALIEDAKSALDRRALVEGLRTPDEPSRMFVQTIEQFDDD